MENLNPNELQHLAQLKDKRKARFEQMGVTPITQIQENSPSEFEQKAMLASASPSGRDRLANIRNIQNGALKTEMRQFNNAESPNDSFQEIPVNLPKRPETAEDRQKKTMQCKLFSPLAILSLLSPASPATPFSSSPAGVPLPPHALCQEESPWQQMGIS